MEYGNRGDEFYKTCMLIHTNTQVKIVATSMSLCNYIRRGSRDNMTFSVYDCNHNFVPHDILPDIVSWSNSQWSQRPSRMYLVHDGIASSLMRE